MFYNVKSLKSWECQVKFSEPFCISYHTMHTNKICPDQSKKGSKVLQDRTVTLGLVLRLDARKWWWWSILLKLDVRSILIRFDGGGPKTRPRYFLYGLSPSYTIRDKFCLFGFFFKLFVCFRVGNVVAITNIYFFYLIIYTCTLEL